MAATAAAEDRTYLFVYGTLKRGEPNHHWMTEPSEGLCKFVATGRTTTKYPLVIASKFNIPFLLDIPGTGKFIKGEVYEVDDKRLSYTDILEAYPKFYTRRKVTVEEDGAPAGQTRDCWIYLLRRHKDFMLKLPFLESYSSNGDHGLRYITSDDIEDPDQI